MKHYLITASIQGDRRIFIRTKKQLYSNLHWKDNYLRWGNNLMHDVYMTEERFKQNIDNLEGLIITFEEIINISLF